MPASNLQDSNSRAERPGAKGKGVEPGEPGKHRLPPARGFLLFTAGLVLLFHRPLLDLLRLSAGSDVLSYIPLVPLICGYFVWLKRKELPCFLGGSRKGALAAFIAGTAILAGYSALHRYGWNEDANDQVSLLTAAFLFLLLSGCCFFLGDRLV